MIRISTYIRLSLGLVFLTVGIVLSAYLLGLIPEQSRLELAKRQAISESLAVLCSKNAEKDDIDTIRHTIEALVERNEEVLSIAFRKADGTLSAVAGNHALHWKGALPEQSSPTHVQVPIFQGDRIWGHVEIAFQPITGQGWRRYFNPIALLIGFISLAGFILYRLFLKKVLKQLDPTSVVPPRVRTALDTMAEGVVLLDNHARIVLANETFSQKIAKSRASLIGRKIDELAWQTHSGQAPEKRLPWAGTLSDQKRQVGVPLCMPDEAGQRQVFMVNTSPIIDSDGKCRGVLATFDDVTQVEQKNEQLKLMIRKLELYNEKIQQQNEKLTYLSTRDPLTGCLNRRSFFEAFDKEFNSAGRYGHPIACVMFDIDHFKSINDTYGHAAGDDVLRDFAAIIMSLVRKVDAVGRYGGEEFCVMLPHIDLEQAAIAAERFRKAIESHDFNGIPVTASFGVSSIAFGAADPAGLIDQADQALYAAKEGGRNRVVTWEAISPAPKPAKPVKPAPQLKPVPKPSEAPPQTPESDTPPEPAPVIPFKENHPRPTAPQGNEDRIEALRLIHDSLTQSARESEAIGLYAALSNDGHAAVKLNNNGGWRDTTAKPAKDKAIDGHAVSQVVKVLQCKSHRKP